MIFYFLAVREVIYKQVRLEFQMIVENRDGKDSLSEFVPLQITRLCPTVHVQTGQSSSSHSVCRWAGCWTLAVTLNCPLFNESPYFSITDRPEYQSYFFPFLGVYIIRYIVSCSFSKHCFNDNILPLQRCILAWPLLSGPSCSIHSVISHEQLTSVP